jgi:hypothetical protein
MSAPTPLAESFLNCINSTFTVGPTGSTWEGVVTEGGVTHTVEVDDMVNNMSLGHHEDVKTIDKYEAEVTIVYQTATPPPFKAGDKFAVVIDHPSGPYFSGNWRFMSVGYPVLNVKGGLKLPVKMTSQAAIVTVRPS